VKQSNIQRAVSSSEKFNVTKCEIAEWQLNDVGSIRTQVGNRKSLRLSERYTEIWWAGIPLRGNKGACGGRFRIRLRRRLRLRRWNCCFSISYSDTLFYCFLLLRFRY
jgi:hypothetical protein